MGPQGLGDSEETAGARTANSTGMLPPPYSLIIFATIVIVCIIAVSFAVVIGIGVTFIRIIIAVAIGLALVFFHGFRIDDYRRRRNGCRIWLRFD